MGVSGCKPIGTAEDRSAYILKTNCVRQQTGCPNRLGLLPLTITGFYEFVCSEIISVTEHIDPILCNWENSVKLPVITSKLRQFPLYTISVVSCENKSDKRIWFRIYAYQRNILHYEACLSQVFRQQSIICSDNNH